MAALRDVLLRSDRRAEVVNDCVMLVDDEVQRKGGLTGVAVKGAYAIVKKVKPGIIREAVDYLLDEFVAVLEPVYDAFLASKETVLDRYLVARDEHVADVLLQVTDRRIDGSKNRTIKGAYQKLRPMGVKHVRAAVPGIARVLERHVGEPVAAA